MATTPEEVRAKVREVVHRTLGLERRGQEKPWSALVTERDVRDLPFGSRLEVAPGRIVTPLARQVAMDRHVRLVLATEPGAPAKPELRADPASGRKVVADEKQAALMGRASLALARQHDNRFTIQAHEQLYYQLIEQAQAVYHELAEDRHPVRESI